MRFVAYSLHARGCRGPELLVVAFLTGAILVTAIDFLRSLLLIARSSGFSTRSCLQGCLSLRQRGSAAW